MSLPHTTTTWDWGFFRGYAACDSAPREGENSHASDRADEVLILIDGKGSLHPFAPRQFDDRERWGAFRALVVAHAVAIESPELSIVWPGWRAAFKQIAFFPVVFAIALACAGVFCWLLDWILKALGGIV